VLDRECSAAQTGFWQEEHYKQQHAPSCKNKKGSEKDIKLLMTVYNQNFDLDSQKRHLKP